MLTPGRPRRATGLGWEARRRVSVATLAAAVRVMRVRRLTGGGGEKWGRYRKWAVSANDEHIQLALVERDLTFGRSELGFCEVRP